MCPVKGCSGGGGKYEVKERSGEALPDFSVTFACCRRSTWSAWRLSQRCVRGRLPTPARCEGREKKEKKKNRGFVKIENYNTFDTSPFAFSAFCTIDVKHSVEKREKTECVGSNTRLPLPSFLMEMWEPRFTWFPYLAPGLISLITTYCMF